MERKELICINCPMGCMLTVDVGGDGEMTVTGNNCPRGENYARKELTDPTRIVTSTVRVTDGELPVVSVKTAADVPKDKIGGVMDALRGVTVEAPVTIGEVIVPDVCSTGVAVIATKAVGRVRT